MKMSDGDGGISQHKRLAMGKDIGGGFGVGPHPGRTDPHPDVGMSHEPMDDSVRSASVGMNQGAPDHGIGKGHPDHFNRMGKA